MKAICKNKFLTFIFMIIFSLILSTSAFAQNNKSITVSYIAENVEFSLYKIGNENSLTGKFANYSVSLEDSAAAQTLAGYIQRDNINADATVKTDSENKAVFEGLDTGLYLVTAKSYVSNNTRYSFNSVIVALSENANSVSIKGKYETENTGGTLGGEENGDDPDSSKDDENNNNTDSSDDNENNNNNDSSSDSEDKNNSSTTDSSDKDNFYGGGSSSSSNVAAYDSISVMKVWSGGNSEKQITAQLLKDGDIYDEVVLSSDNNWRHTWDKLSKASVWNVVEKESFDNYTVSVRKDSNLFVITNTYKPLDSPDEDENDKDFSDNKDNNADLPNNSADKSTDDKSGSSSDNDNSADNNSSGNDNSGDANSDNGENDGSAPSDGSNDEQLPQTGQLWWPVIILSCLGVLSLIFGLGLKREGR